MYIAGNLVGRGSKSLEKKNMKRAARVGVANRPRRCPYTICVRGFKINVHIKIAENVGSNFWEFWQFY